MPASPAKNVPARRPLTALRAVVKDPWAGRPPSVFLLLPPIFGPELTDLLLSLLPALKPAGLRFARPVFSVARDGRLAVDQDGKYLDPAQYLPPDEDRGWLSPRAARYLLPVWTALIPFGPIAGGLWYFTRGRPVGRFAGRAVSYLVVGGLLRASMNILADWLIGPLLVRTAERPAPIRLKEEG